MSTIETEHQILDVALANLKAEGYDVFRQPPPSMLPAFMAGYRPDVVAIGPTKSIAIDIIVDGTGPSRQGERKDRFAGQEGWEHRVIYVRPDAAGKNVREASRDAIERSLSSIDQLAGSGLPTAALLIGWATLEALGRRLCPTRLRRPQAPGRLVEVLASEGQLTPDEADCVRRLVDTRNRLIHGDLDVDVTRETVERFARILRTLLEQAEAQAANG